MTVSTRINPRGSRHRSAHHACQNCFALVLALARRPWGMETYASLELPRMKSCIGSSAGLEYPLGPLWRRAQIGMVRSCVRWGVALVIVPCEARVSCCGCFCSAPLRFCPPALACSLLCPSLMPAARLHVVLRHHCPPPAARSLRACLAVSPSPSPVSCSRPAALLLPPPVPDAPGVPSPLSSSRSSSSPARGPPHTPY